MAKAKTRRGLPTTMFFDIHTKKGHSKGYTALIWTGKLPFMPAGGMSFEPVTGRVLNMTSMSWDMHSKNMNIYLEDLEAYDDKDRTAVIMCARKVGWDLLEIEDDFDALDVPRYHP